MAHRQETRVMVALILTAALLIAGIVFLVLSGIREENKLKGNM